MRILIYSINYFPELTGIGKYNAEMAEWLAGKGDGLRKTLICCTANLAS
jgi:colanic acid biosynthesis glycosyl transferase WcaI